MTSTEFTVNRLKITMTKVYLIGACFLASFVWLIMLFSNDPVQDQNDPYTIDVTQHSTYVEQAAAQLSKDRIYLDPLLEAGVGQWAVADDVRAAMSASDTPIYLAVTPLAGDARLDEGDALLARLADAVGQPGMYLTVDQQGRARSLYMREDPRFLYLSLNGGRESTYSLKQFIDGVDGAVSEQEEAQKGQLDNAYLGVFMGLTLSVPLWFLMRFLRWSAQRDRSYLKGFRA